MAWREREGYDEEVPWWLQPDVPPSNQEKLAALMGEAVTPTMAPVPTAPAAPTAPTAPTTGGNPNAPPDGSTTPNMDPPGFQGGYWMGGQWVRGERGGGGSPPYPGPLSGSTTSSFDGSSFQWPTYSPTQFDPGAAFKFKDFVSPSGQEVLDNPGFQFRMDQGRKALEASRAGRGILNSGATGKALTEYGQNFGSHEYGNVWNRAMDEWKANRENAFGMWNSQYGQRKDKYGFDEDANRFGFNSQQRQAELNFQDQYNRWLAEGNWTKDLATAGLD